MLAETVKEWPAKWLEEGRKEGRGQGRVEGLEEGRVKGLEEGRVEGLEEGRVEGLREAVNRQLRLKFGNSVDLYADHLATASEKSLLVWAERLLWVTGLEEVFSGDT